MTLNKIRNEVNDLEDLLHKPEEVMKYLGLDSTGALAQMRYRGTGPRFIKVGKLVRYRDSDIKEWLEENVKERT